MKYISYIGGLVGRNNGAISNSYATVSVNGGNAVGGLVGMQNANITNSYATGAVTGTTNVGGLVGSVNSGSVTNSYWNWATTGQAASAAGTRIDTTVLMQTQAMFTGFDFTVAPVWRIYAGHSYPLLKSFLTPLTVTASAASKTYDGAAYSGGNGVSYSVAPNANLLGTVSYSGTSQGATNAGSYVITPSGLYSNQQGYDITYVDGTLTIAAAPTAPVYCDPGPPPAPTLIDVLPGGIATLTGATPVTAAPGQPVIMYINGGVITAGNSGGAVRQFMNSDGTATLCVTDGYVVLPANAFAAIKNDKLYAGEIAQIGVDGTVTQVRLGSVAGNAGIAGDKRSQSDTAFLKYRTWVPLLDAIPSRFGAALKLLDAIVAVLNRDFSELTYLGTQVNGSLRFGTADGRLISALPVGTVEVDTSRPDGVTIDTHGKAKVATQGLITRFSANSIDLPTLAAGIRAGCPTCVTVQLEDGNLHVTHGDIVSVGVPDWYADATFGNAANGTANHTSAGLSQTIHPAAGDLEALLAACG